MQREFSYRDTAEAIDKIHNVMRNNGRISFQTLRLPEDYKGFFFSAVFQQSPEEQKHYYVKWESSSAYKTIWTETPELSDAKDGGKTINEKLLSSIGNKYPNLSLIFADHYAIRIIDYDYFLLNSYPFMQKYNQERVRGIDIRKLVDITAYFERSKKK